MSTNAVELAYKTILVELQQRNSLILSEQYIKSWGNNLPWMFK